jgi:predicted metal-dependent phosphotriesterase family hydrolase
MTSGTVVTVSGPIAPADLGPTDAHEHLFLETPAQPGEGVADLVRAEVEVEEGAATGLRAIVELTPIGLGRQPDLLRQLSESTGVHIVAATGYHRDAHYAAGHPVLEATGEELTQRAVAELQSGMDETDIRAGVIKGGASHEQITGAEERRLRAIARAAATTGAPLVIHTEAGTCGHEIVDLLLDEGAAVDRITLAHMDRNMAPPLHAELAARGVSLVYDTIGRVKYAPDEARLALIEQMVAAGHAGSLMLGLDLGRRGYHRAWGGEPGLRHLLADFVPRLRERIGPEQVDRMLVDNPARVFAWR